MSTLALADPIVNPATADNPRDSWPAWTDESRWELGPEPDPAPEGAETGPTAGPDFEPTPEEMACWMGLSLGLEEDEGREYRSWLDRRAEERMAEAFGGSGDGWPDSERIEARGILEFRREGGAR